MQSGTGRTTNRDEAEPQMNICEKTIRLSDSGAGECSEELPFKRGDRVRWKTYRFLRGIIEDGWVIYKEDPLNFAGNTTVNFLIRLSNGAIFTAAPSEIELVQPNNLRGG